MKPFKTFLRWLRGFGQAKAVKQEIDEELRFHLEQRTAENLAAGMTPEAAAREARKHFGNLQSIREECHEAKGASFGEAALRDVRFGLRMLRKNPGFTAAAVLTLALGVGVNSALFSVLYAVLLEPLPYSEPGRLVQVQSTISAPGKPAEIVPPWSYPRFELLRDHNRIFAQIAAFDSRTLTVTGTDRSERVEAELASASYLPLLGVRAVLGRVFLPEEDLKGAARPVVVISEGYWRRHFGGDPGVIGRTLRANQTPLTIVGVVAAGFKGQSGATEMWVPITLTPTLEGDPSRLERPFTMWHRVLARLQPSTSLATARASLDSLERQLESVLPVSSEKEAYGIHLVPFREAATDPFIRRSLWVLAAAVGFVLLIACLNVANLLLARAAAREREIAIRLALGATRGQLIRQLLAESLVLAAISGAVALLFARWAIDAMAAFQPADNFGFQSDYARLPDFGAIRLSAPVLAFNFCAALGCGLISGLFPASQTARRSLSPALHRSSDRSLGGDQGLGLRGARNLLVVSETALALMLLVGAGLMVQSLARLTTTRTGFDPKHLLTFRLDQPGGLSDSAKPLFFPQILERVGAIPGVESACLANAAPLSGTYDRSFMVVSPAANGGGGVEAFIGVHLASQEFLHTLRVPLVRGRWFTDQDRPGTPLVAVVNETAARKYWPGRDPVGQRTDLSPALGPGFAAVEVVGVIGDVKYDAMAAEMGANVYLSYRQSGYPGYYVNLRTAGDPLAVAAAVRTAVAAVSSEVPVYDLMTMQRRIANSTSRTAFNTLLLLAFAALAVVLAAVGLYGVVAYSVTQHTREIGIRMALGARPADVLRLIVTQGLRLVLVGGLIGLVGAVALTRLMRSLLFGVSPTDPLTFAAILVMLTGVALLACWLPARRAVKVDPMVALRCE
jgi:putative ABC transport system permease protein